MTKPEMKSMGNQSDASFERVERAAQKLLEWCPQAAMGSSGFDRKVELSEAIRAYRAALDQQWAIETIKTYGWDSDFVRKRLRGLEPKGSAPYNYERYAGHMSLQIWDEPGVTFPKFLKCADCGASYRIEDLERMPSHEVASLARAHSHGR